MHQKKSNVQRRDDYRYKGGGSGRDEAKEASPRITRENHLQSQVRTTNETELLCGEKEGKTGTDK